MKKVLLTTVMSLMMFMGVFAQDYLNAPKAGEKVIGSVSITDNNNQSKLSNQNIYTILLEKAKTNYPNFIVDIRDMQSQETSDWDVYIKTYFYHYTATGKVVWVRTQEEIIQESLSQALNKALRNVREGSRIAIDQVTVTSSMDRGEFKDQLIDVLLDKGYKVVAKDYLEKLYDEIKDQQSGIYNDKTTVKEDNFSAVGYYINVKVTETSLRVQVVNVSTGEYEGNATVNF